MLHHPFPDLYSSLRSNNMSGFYRYDLGPLLFNPLLYSSFITSGSPVSVTTLRTQACYQYTRPLLLVGLPTYHTKRNQEPTNVLKTYTYQLALEPTLTPIFSRLSDFIIVPSAVPLIVMPSFLNTQCQSCGTEYSLLWTVKLIF